MQSVTVAQFVVWKHDAANRIGLTLRTDRHGSHHNANLHQSSIGLAYHEHYLLLIAGCLMSSGESKPLQLQASIDAFVPGATDTFTVRAAMLGALTQIRVSHNAKGAHADWMVEMVRIVHIQSEQEWLFFGHVWLHSGNGHQVVLRPGQST